MEEFSGTVQEEVESQIPDQEKDLKLNVENTSSEKEPTGTGAGIPEMNDKSENMGFNLEQYLIEKVYPELNITEDDRKMALDGVVEKGISPEALEITDRSFANIKETLRLFFSKVTEEGFYDRNSAEKDKLEVLLKAKKEYNIWRVGDGDKYDLIRDVVVESEGDLQLARQILLQKRDEGIVGQNQLDLMLEKFESLKMDEFNESQSSSYGAGEDQCPPRIRVLYKQATDIYTDGSDEYSKYIYKVTPEEACAKLIETMDRIGDSFEIPYACKSDTLRKIIEKGRAVNILDLEKSEFDTAVASRQQEFGWRDQYSGDGMGYLGPRKKVEDELGYKDGNRPLYGILTSEGNNSVTSGYGAYSFVINREEFQSIYFCEGDSMPASQRLDYIGKLKDGEALAKNPENKLAASAKSRQLTYDHAVISMAAKSCIASFGAMFGASKEVDGAMDYQEAHILGGIPFDRQHIKEIRVNSGYVRNDSVGEDYLETSALNDIVVRV